MSNVINNYFTSIAEKAKSNIKFSPKHTDYLSSTNTNTLFLTPTDKNEIAFIISSLDSHKSSGPNSIPVKILNLKNDISQQLSDIFNVFLDLEIFFCSENSQSHYTQKNNLKLIMQIIDQYVTYLILKKLLRNSCTKDCLIFWISTI